MKSCIFHYEFEFIHPFADGNGRTGRLWQTLILYKWKEFFAWLPVETLVHENQDDYYKAIQLSNNAGESTIFVEFMLRMIRDALKELVENQKRSNVGINVATNEEKLMELLLQDGHLTARVLASSLGITERQVQRMISKLKQQGKLVRHGASKNGFWEVKE